MKTILTFLKNNIFTIMILFVFIIGMFIASYVKKVFWDNNDKAAYGNRLDGIENYELSEEEVKSLKQKILENKNVSDVVYDVEGKIINLIITVNDDVKVADAKKLGSEATNYLSETQLSFFSVQVFLKKKDEKQTSFPIIGYRHYGDKTISWTKDR